MFSMLPVNLSILKYFTAGTGLKIYLATCLPMFLLSSCWKIKNFVKAEFN